MRRECWATLAWPPIKCGKPFSDSFEEPDVWQVAILLGVIKAVANHEFVLDREADVVHLDLNFAPARLAQQAGRAQGSGTAREQDFLKVMQRQSGIDDVFDND